MKPTPLSSRAATSPSVSHSSSSSERGRRRKQTTPSETGAASSSCSLASIRSRASSARSRHRSIEARNASSPKRAQGEPELERPRRPRQLQAEIGEVHLLQRRVGVAEVVGADLERVPQRSAVANEQAAALIRLIEPLVGIESDRVGQRDALECRAPALGQDGEATVGSVDVQPDPVLPAERRQVHDRIDRAGARGARVRDREKRAPSVCHIGRDRVCEGRRLQPQVLADGQDPHLVRPEAERPRGPCERRVRLIGDVDHEVVAHRADQGLPRAGERGQVRGRPAGDERPCGLGRVADPVLEPAEDLQLQLRRAGRLHPGARVDVARAGDEVSERSGPRAGRRHEREVAGVAGTARIREDVTEEPLEHAFERLPFLGRRLRELARDLSRRGPPQECLRVVAEPVDERVDRPVAELAHPLGIELEPASF